MVRLLVTEFGKDLKGSNLRFIQKNILEFFWRNNESNERKPMYRVRFELAASEYHLPLR
jgi:hypothetical protein